LESILHTAYVLDACALPSILFSLSFTDMIYFTPENKSTPPSVKGIGVEIILIWISPLHNFVKILLI